jgi:sporulation protein YhbH
MAVVKPDYDSAPRGKKDAARHREKVKEAIRQNLPDIISDEAIITRKENQVVKVPIRGVKSYHFIHGQTGGGGGGIGSGESKKGKVIGQRPKPDNGKPGKPGGEPGIDYIETEIDLAELIEMMLQDLGLPNLQQKEVKEAVVPRGWTFESIEKHGIRPRLDKKRTIKEAIKRVEVLVAQLMRESGRPEPDCRAALDLASGDAGAALELLKSNETLPKAGEQIIRLESSDLRFRTLTQDVEFQSNAVVLAMMDVSGSMGTMKKYLARSFFFWMLSFLKTIYKHVEIRFIAHTTEAKLVDEHEFFHKGESGGTSCFAAYDLAAELIDKEYPPSRWNVYPFHFSDGEDWDADRTLKSVKSVLERGVSALGYGEIQTEYSASVLMDTFRKNLPLGRGEEGNLIYYEGSWEKTVILGTVIRSKEDLYPALRIFLKQGQEV